jgi:hypothetical protein
MKLKFYKKDDRWYADVPGHTEEENEMVAGSDEFLDYISKGKSEITLEISDIPKQNLRIDVVLNSENAKKYNLDSGEIRPMLDWLRK